MSEHKNQWFRYFPGLGLGLQTKVLEKLVEKLHWVVAVILGFEALNFITSTAFGFSPEEYLRNKLSVYISETSSLVPIANFMYFHETVILLTIVALLMLIIHRLKVDTTDKNFRLTTSQNDLLARQSYFSAYAQCEVVFRNLAYENAHRDAEFFNALFVDVAVSDFSRATAAQIQSRLSAIHIALRVASHGLTNVLDAAKKLLDNMTGDTCAVCIQALENTGGDIEKADIETVMRDTESAASRLNVYKQSLDANDLSKRIFIDFEPFVIENDLKAKLNSNRIRSSSYNIGNLYNAVCIVPVPVLGNKNARPTASLCVDNMKGFPEDRQEACVHFAKELGWRVAVMQYRLVGLQLEKEKLEMALNEFGAVR